MRTGRVIPIPPSHDETIDYKSPESYAEGDKDTLKKDVEKVTFKVCQTMLFKNSSCFKNSFYKRVLSCSVISINTIINN